MRRAALVFPGATAQLAREHAAGAHLVIAVDAGAEALRIADLVPHALVGDLDSVAPETAEWARRAGADVDRHPARKDETDGELALRRAQGCDEVLFVGAGGGRADHALGNLHLLLQASHRARAWAVDHDAIYWMVTPERSLELELPEGALVSAIPFSERVEGVTYRSMAYPLDEATLLAGTTRGLSNLAGPPPQHVRVRSGALLIVAPKTPE